MKQIHIIAVAFISAIISGILFDNDMKGLGSAFISIHVTCLFISLVKFLEENK